MAGDFGGATPHRADKRRDALIKAEAARLARKTDEPVIVAGSTGSIPSTAELIATIARLPHGAVVLPGLDTDLDEASWRLIAGDEKRESRRHRVIRNSRWQALLARIGIARDAVVPLAMPRGRERLVSEALRPAAATELWRATAADPGFGAHADAALATMAMIEAANPEDEALAIAVALREAVHDGKTAALVTPDRALGRRVLAALATLEHRGGGFRRRRARRHAGGNFCPPCRRRRARWHAAGDAAGLAQASAAAAWLSTTRRRRARTRHPARAAAARRLHRPRFGAGQFSCPARKVSP